ncbi:MAG: hypothetical protein ACNA7L_03015 [Roseinatronobacter sp.]
MNTGFIFALFGIGALFAFSDFFSGSGSDEKTDTPPQDDDKATPALPAGTAGDDLLFSAGGEVLEGFGGNDTLITIGDSTLMGGEGDDTLVSYGGGAVLMGGEGEDTFEIKPLPLGANNALLDKNGQPVAPTVINDFSPDADRLVLDLRGSSFPLFDDDTVTLTGVPAPDGEGLMVQVDGVDVVQLSSYGGGDMQAALEALVTDFGALDVIGAEFQFPETEEERIARTGIGNRGDNLIIAQGGLDEIRGLQGNDTLVGFTGPGVSLFGASGDDVLVAFGNDSAFGGSGDDILIGDYLIASDGPQVLDGGYGQDVLISHGGSVMTGGPGADIFVISPAGIDDDGNFMAADGTPLPVSTITDFDTERDTLVLDLQKSSEANVATWAIAATGKYDSSRPDPVFGSEVEISVVATDDGSMVLVDGIKFVGLQGLTPEEVVAGVDIQVQGAEYTFALPENVALPGTLIEPGLSQLPDDSDDFKEPTYYLGNNYAGDVFIPERAAIDLTLYQGDLSVTIEENGTVLIEDANDDSFSLTMASVTQISIGEGQNTVDASASGALVSVYVASFGTDNTIIGGAGPTRIISFAGEAYIEVGSGAAEVQAYSGNDTVVGGTGTLEVFTADDGNAFVSDAFGEITNLYQAGPTIIEAVDAAVSGSIGVGDKLALGEGPNNIIVYGLSPTDLGPALITGFDPDPSGFNSFEYVGVFSELAPDGGSPAPTAVLEERGDDLFVVENGRDMVHIVNLSLEDVQRMPADRFDVSQNFFRAENA